MRGNWGKLFLNDLWRMSSGRQDWPGELEGGFPARFSFRQSDLDAIVTHLTRLAEVRGFDPAPQEQDDAGATPATSAAPDETADDATADDAPAAPPPPHAAAGSAGPPPGTDQPDPRPDLKAQEAKISGGIEWATLSRFVSPADDRLDGDSATNLLAGGDGADLLAGHGGRDILVGGPGADVYLFLDPSDSTGAAHDVIVGLDADDRIDLPVAISAIAAEVIGGSLSEESFDDDLAAALAGLGAGQAAMFRPDGGGLAGRLFLVADANGVDGYQAGEDYVWQIMPGESDPVITPDIFI